LVRFGILAVLGRRSWAVVAVERASSRLDNFSGRTVLLCCDGAPTTAAWAAWRPLCMIRGWEGTVETSARSATGFQLRTPRSIGTAGTWDHRTKQSAAASPLRTMPHLMFSVFVGFSVLRAVYKVTTQTPAKLAALPPRSHTHAVAHTHTFGVNHSARKLTDAAPFR
jgi:hypothetical protein